MWNSKWGNTEITKARVAGFLATRSVSEYRAGTKPHAGKRDQRIKSPQKEVGLVVPKLHERHALAFQRFTNRRTLGLVACRFRNHDSCGRQNSSPWAFGLDSMSRSLHIIYDIDGFVKWKLRLFLNYANTFVIFQYDRRSLLLILCHFPQHHKEVFVDLDIIFKKY